MMKKLFILLTVLMYFYSCSNENTDYNFSIQGTVKNGEGKEMYLNKIINKNFAKVDTVKLTADGKYKFTGNIEQTDYIIVGDPRTNNFIPLLISPNENLTVDADYNNLHDSYTVEGSKDSKIMHQLYTDHAIFKQKIDSLEKKFRTAQNQENFEELSKEMQTNVKNIIEEERTYIKSFVSENKTSIASIFALLVRMQIGQQSYSIINIEEDMEYFENTEKSLSELYPNSHLVNRLKQIIDNYKNAPPMPQGGLEIGDMAKEIALPSPEGKKIALSSLKGKYVLLDFWAAWCRPCRNESPNLIANYKKYNKDGFEIFQVSLDKRKEDWTKAIAKDKLSWPNHVSDLKFWSSEAAQLYNVRSIPANYLLDKDGKIIAKNLRGADLGVKLAEIFGH